MVPLDDMVYLGCQGRTRKGPKWTKGEISDSAK